MTEMETKVLESFKKVLAKVKNLEPEQIDDLVNELSNDTPNPERLAEIVKSKKKLAQSD